MNTGRSARMLDYLMLAGGLLAGLAGSFALRSGWARAQDGGVVWIPFLAAAGLAGWGLRRIDRWLPEAAPAAREGRYSPPGWKLVGRICLAAAGLITLWLMARLWPDYQDWSGTPGPWIFSMLLTGAGGYLLGGMEQEGRRETGGEGHEASKAGRRGIPLWLEILLFAGIAALALYLRLHRLDEIPAGIYVDETNGALDALNILEGGGASPFGTGWYGTPNGFTYYMAGLFKWFGPTTGTLKAVSLIPAVLTVLAVYPLGKLLWGSLGGLSAMFLMAVSRWHLSMSRWGWNETAPLLFQVLATFFLLRGLRDRRASDFAVGGLISGLMMYTYLSSRLALATIGIFVLVYLLTRPGGLRSALSRHGRGLALFAMAWAAAFAPLAVTHITDPFTFNNRVQEISIFRDTAAAGSLQPLWANVRDHLTFFHVAGDRQGKHNLPFEPQTDPFTGLFFVVGLAYGLQRPKDWRYWLLWLWILLGLAGGIFSSRHESPQSYRTLTVVPAVTLLAGDAIIRFGRATAGLIRHSGPVRLQAAARPAGVFLACTFLAAAAIWETSIYFGRQADSLAYQAGFNLVENGVAHEAVSAADSGMPLYLSPRFYDFSPLRFLIYGEYKQSRDENTLDNRPYHLFRPEQDLPLVNTGSDALILLDTYYLPVMDTFLNYYPDAAVEVVKWRGEIPLYIRVQVPEANLAAIQGLQMRYQTGSEAAERRVDNIDEHWGSETYSSVEWTGQVRLPRSGPYEFTGSPGLAVGIDGELQDGARVLCSGLHTIQVKAGQIQDGETYLGWLTPLGSEEIISPDAFFYVPAEAQGLTAAYYSNPNWEGEPLCKRNTPFLLLAWPDQDPVKGPFSARFSGALRIEVPGRYNLRLNADDGVRLTLDGNVLAEGLAPNQPNEIRAGVNLEAGDHPIVVDYFQLGGGSALEFYWQMGNDPETPVPPRALVPDLSQP